MNIPVIDVHPVWVYKLTGKHVDFKTPDCEFDARRIHCKTANYQNYLSLLAIESKALRIQVVT